MHIKPILCLFQTFYIIMSEAVFFAYNKNYTEFIERLSQRLTAINILYVKIFQAIALNNHFIDDATNNLLLKYTDRAPWNWSDVDGTMYQTLREQYNISMEPIPFSSGMISIVFNGYEIGNPENKFVIKMKRRNIEHKLNAAIDNLMLIMYLLSFIPFINNYQINEVIQKNIDVIKHQTNFIEEIDNMRRIGENCKQLKYVKIPTANRAITEAYPNIIVMNYIDGMKINEIDKEDYASFAKLVVKFGIVTTILHGFTHGDLHSGNILFIKDEKDTKYPHKIGILDFGIVYDVNTQYKGMLFDIFTQMFENAPRESAEKLLNSGILDPPNILRQIPKADYEEIVKFTADIIQDTIFVAENANQIQVYKFLSKLKEYLSKESLQKIGIRPSDDFVKSQLVLAMAHGVTLTLCKDNFIPLMDEVINELFHTSILFR